MSSHSNRRVRAQRKRHVKLVTRLRDRLRTFKEQGRHKEAVRVEEQLSALLPPVRIVRSEPVPEPKRAPARRAFVGTLAMAATLATLGVPLAPPPPAEKQDPKVHGVNAQRESKAKPTVGGARGKRRPSS